MLKRKSKPCLERRKFKSETTYIKSNFVAQPGRAEDYAAVASLPDTWVPKHSGSILANYLKERKQKHGHLLKYMKAAAVDVNSQIDGKIRILAQNLLEHIQQNQRSMNNITNKCAEKGVPITKEIRGRAFNEIYQCFSQYVDDISRFKIEALTLERQRVDGLRSLLRDYFQQFVGVGHKTPKDLLHNFDQRIYDINQQLLSNCRAYTQLEARLRVQADENLVLMRSALNQLSLGLNMACRIGSSQLLLKEENSSHKRATSAVDKKKIHSCNPSFKKILDEGEEFEECVSCFVLAYRTAVLKVFTGFSSKLSTLQKDLGNHYAIHDQDRRRSCEINDLRQMIDQTLHRLFSSVHQKQTPSMDLLAITDADIASMQRSLCSLGDSLWATYTILHDAGHLWDSHMLRLALAQKLTIAAVEDLLTSNDSLELANELCFNIALEQLRCSPDPDKLQQQFEVIMTMLHRTSNMYLQDSQTEIGRLNDFMKLLPLLSRILLAEFDCFLEKNRRTTLHSKGSMSEQRCTDFPRWTQATILRPPLPRAILQTELQEVALKNWCNGFLESFHSNMTFVPEELQRQARLWIEERAVALNMRYSLKLVSNSIRSERVRAARDYRLLELRFHDTRLDSHLAAVYNLTDTLPIEASEFLSVDSEHLYPLCNWISRIQADLNIMLAQETLDPEMRRLKMLSYDSRVTKHRRLFEESLDDKIEQCKRQFQHRIQEGRISNVRFMSQINLFSEGGRYAALEATKTCAALVKSGDALELCLHRSLDALSHRRIQLLSMADQLLIPIQRLVGDISKVGGKGPDKKKPPPLRKK